MTALPQVPNPMAMPIPVSDRPGSNILHSVIEHVFMPPVLPQMHPGEQIERKINVELCDNLIEAAHDFLRNLPSSESPLWMHMIKMMELARCAAKAPFKKADLQRALSGLAPGGTYRYRATLFHF
jgi:hypothetical protein